MRGIDLLHKNVKWLCKCRGMQMRDVEKEIGVSTGYLSRSKNLGIDKVMKIAEIFGLTIDELMKKDFSYLDEQKKLEKIIRTHFLKTHSEIEADKMTAEIMKIIIETIYEKTEVIG